MDKFVNNIFLCYFKWLAFVLLKKMLRKKIISQHFLNYDLESIIWLEFNIFAQL